MKRLLARASPIIAVYVLANVMQLVVLVAAGVVTGFHLGALVPDAVLVVMLARRNRLAWWLLIALNGLPVLLSTTLLGAGTLWGHLILSDGTGLVLLALLVSQPMRAYVTAGRPRRPLRAGGAV
jgi:uncharacterized membrane protein